MSGESFRPLATVSARDLLKSPPPEPGEVVPGILPVGLSLLAAAPKVGKSWLAYQLAIAVAIGGEFLGHVVEWKGDVLYLALEDGEHRAWSRMSKLLRREVGEADDLPGFPAHLDLAFNAERGDALVAQVEHWLEGRKHAKLVIIDTLQKVRARSTGRRSQYELDAEDVGRIQGLAQRHPALGVLVVHHDTKASRAPGSDFVDAVSGTSGIAGGVDAILVLRRRRHETAGTLDITGRDIRESLLHLAYDDDDPHWSLDRVSGLVGKEREVYEWLSANGDGGPTAIGEGTGQDKGNASVVLDRLIDKGVVVRRRRGVYGLVVDGLYDMGDHNNHNDNNDDNSDNDDNA